MQFSEMYEAGSVAPAASLLLPLIVTDPSCGGAGSVSFQKLSQACSQRCALSTHGKRIIETLERGELPKDYKQWPQPEDVGPPRAVVFPEL
eukprot:7817924-Pyramimonas_sp.AAC.1